VSAYAEARDFLLKQRSRWLVTGAAGFIGSNLVETLLLLDQDVVGLDNFDTGYRRNLDDIATAVGEQRWRHFELVEADVVDLNACHAAARGVSYVLHQAALGSVPRSLDDPIGTNAANVDGFVNMLVASRDAEVKRFVYASSSAVYGDDPGLPKTEEQIGAPLSPYALSKSMDEQYAAIFHRCYGMYSVGLRYFNVFGQRQDPNGAYAAVIPRWIATMLAGEPVIINGDGETSRDFCYVTNVVQANILAALAPSAVAESAVYNVALGKQTSLLALYDSLRKALTARMPGLSIQPPTHRDFRPGDVRHSVADVGKAMRHLRYAPTHSFDQGISEAIGWYIDNNDRLGGSAT
jgi:UDP-N-acetylglucosamine 4-epimerase